MNGQKNIRMNSKEEGDILKRVALVSGGADGLGRSIALALHGEGYAVGVLDLNEEKLARIESESHADDFAAFKCNVTDEEAVLSCVHKMTEKFGRIDVLVNVAGGSLGISGKLEDISLADWNRVVGLNLTGTFICTKAVVPIMKKQKYGRIINMSSMAGRSRSVFGATSYSASKAGVLGFTRQASRELAPEGITINAIAPGTVLSGERIASYWDKKPEEEKRQFFDANPSGRLGVNLDIVRGVLFLCHEDASYINGAVIDINGGMWVG